MTTKVPENFRPLIRDFTNDLTTVFPENDIHWRRWGDEDATDEEMQELFEYCSRVYPERFFDILYQNEEIFSEDSRIETDFLPKMRFKYLFNAEGVSENTKKTMWKYLQLILFTVVGNIDDKKSFGESMEMFEGIDEKMLQEKMEETMNNISSVFESYGEKDESKTENTEEQPNMEGPPNMEGMPNMEGLPNMENLHSHLQKLFDGKIGKLAKELAEEVADDFKDALGGDIENSNPQDVIKSLMKNPNKIKNLMKTVSTRLDDKMKSGEISREDIMKEAGDFLNQVKQTGGDAGVNDMLKSVMKNMGGLGKNAKINKNALNKLMNQSENKEKMRKKAEDRKNQLMAEKKKLRDETFERLREQNRLKAQYRLEQKENPSQFVYKLDGVDVQEKSFVHPDLIEEMKKEDELDNVKKESTGSKKKKKKKNK